MHTVDELRQKQALPLSAKIRMTQRRINDWVTFYGLDGVYVSFSGGKDSTVLLHIARELFPDIKAVFSDTGLEYPEVRAFVNTFENVDIVKPEMNFRQVIEKYGYPFISKEISDTVYDARRYLTKLNERRASLTDRQTDSGIIPNYAHMADILGIDRRKDKENNVLKNLMMGIIPNIPDDAPVRLKSLYGVVEHKEKGKLTGEYSRRYDRSKYLFFLDAPFNLSAKCCKVMKKNPMHRYAKRTGRHPITGQMAEESFLRQSNWLKHGCNGFDMKEPISNPMSFWTEQDVLLYIKLNNIPIASVYGDIVIDYEAMGTTPGQVCFEDFYHEFGLGFEDVRPLKTTGCSRTGCMFCGYGCHLEKSPNRFEMMKETHPKLYEYIMRPWESEITLTNPETLEEETVTVQGLNYKEVIDWINEHGNMNIKY